MLQSEVPKSDGVPEQRQRADAGLLRFPCGTLAVYQDDKSDRVYLRYSAPQNG